jgi:hypothetical protein
MATFASISAVGKSLERYLNACFSDDPPIALKTTKAMLVRTEDLDPKNSDAQIPKPGLSIFLYRVDFNKTMRAGWSAVGHLDGKSHLPVDLHFLLTPWASDAESELLILGRAMQAIEAMPNLSGPLLPTAGGFAPNETVQLILEDVPTDSLMRTFDSLQADYKLSVPYIARVVRIDSQRAAPSPTVLTVVTGATPSVDP